jgi:hypothetical protein
VYNLFLAARLADAEKLADVVCTNPDDPEQYFLLSLICTELDCANIEKFVSSVDSVYTKAFVDQYTNFVSGVGYLLDRQQRMMEMYELMKTLFPLVHSVLHQNQKK